MNLPVPIDGLQSYFNELGRFPVLNREDEHGLALRYHETGDVAAAQQLVLANLRFVIKIANEYKAYGFRMADLIQEGNLGLMVAVKKFDPHRGFRLISYAVWWIRAYIQNFIIRSWSLVRIGTTQAQRKLFYKLRQKKNKLLSSLGDGDLTRALHSTEAHHLAEKMALKEEEVMEMDARLSGRDLSLNAPTSEDSQVTHLDLLCTPDNQETVVADKQVAEQLSDDVKGALKTLNPREQYIVTQRLMADEPMTLQALGDHFKISRERARQLEARAKQKLRAALA
jgi:RNA polymerase sigma-32 factor